MPRDVIQSVRYQDDYLLRMTPSLQFIESCQAGIIHCRIALFLFQLRLLGEQRLTARPVAENPRLPVESHQKVLVVSVAKFKESRNRLGDCLSPRKLFEFKKLH